MSAHLEKVLRHAERKLIHTARTKPADMLDLYGDFLKLEEKRLLMAHRAGEGGLDFTRKRAEMFSVVLRHMFRGALDNVHRSHSLNGSFPPLAMIAVGGFGRGELSPYSDIDLLFLYDKARPKSPAHRAVTDAVEQVLYMLWDTGIKVGHATRNMDESVEQGREDFQTMTSLLESRLLDGDATLFSTFQTSFERLCLGGRAQRYIEWRRADQDARHRKFGGTVFVQEPQVKNGCGGLRDYHNIVWSARVARGVHGTIDLQQTGLLSLTERKALDAAYDFILRVRNELHFQQNRGGDILTLKLQGDIADAFGYRQPDILRRTEALMRDYYQHSRNIYQIGNLCFRRFGVGKPSTRMDMLRNLLPSASRQDEKEFGVVEHGGELHPGKIRGPGDDPVNLLKIFRLLQQRNASLSPELETILRQKTRFITHRSLLQPETRELLFHLAAQKGKGGRTFRAMHEVGILGRLIPEFGPLTCLVQHEFFHRYSADEHTLVCLEQLDLVLDAKARPFSSYRSLFEDCTEPDILYLALVLHDTGKAANSADHEQAGVQLAVRFARRMKLNGRRLQLLTFLVDHHMTLNEFATRRNIDDPRTILDFARIVQDQERLDMLMLLTFADGKGTDIENNWSDWKEGLVWHLYARTCAMLDGGEEFLRLTRERRRDVQSRARKLLPKGISYEEIDAHFSALPGAYLDFRHGEHAARHITLVHDFMLRLLEHDDYEDTLRPVVHWLHHEEAGHSEVTIVTWDRDHLFTKVAGAFSLAGLNILNAEIWTRSDHIVIDTFRVCTERGASATHKIDQKSFEDALTRSLLDPDFDLEREIRHSRKSSTAPLQDVLEPAVGFDNESAADCSLLHVRAPDHIGLLFDISSAISEANCSINSARICTEKGAALDTFYLTDQEGRKLTDRAHVRRLMRGVTQRLKLDDPP